MATVTNPVQTLISKAAQANSSDDAMKFAQAAVNSAKALCELAISKTYEPTLSNAGAGLGSLARQEP